MKTFRQLLESIKLSPKSSEATQKVIDDFEAQTTEHPLNPKARLTPDHVGVELEPMGPNVVHIKSITSHGERGVGHASKALRALTNLADKHGVGLHLISHPITGRTGLDRQQLTNWYGRHGFDVDEDHFGYREPRTVIKLTGFKRQH